MGPVEGLSESPAGDVVAANARPAASVTNSVAKRMSRQEQTKLNRGAAQLNAFVSAPPRLTPSDLTGEPLFNHSLRGSISVRLVEELLRGFTRHIVISAIVRSRKPRHGGDKSSTCTALWVSTRRCFASSAPVEVGFQWLNGPSGLVVLDNCNSRALCPQQPAPGLSSAVSGAVAAKPEIQNPVLAQGVAII